MSSSISAEIASQPECWNQAAALAAQAAHDLPRPGERVAVVGCGTSWFMAMAYAALREASGQGETDAFSGSEMPRGRTYERVVAISRSGTTTEIVDLVQSMRVRSVCLTAVPQSALTQVTSASVVLDFADERSVVQTRFATSTLSLLRAHLGHDVPSSVEDAKTASSAPIIDLTDVDQITFLGQGWTVGLAHEAALKTRETAQFWAESYPAMDYRHGPISIAQPGRQVWSFGDLPLSLGEEIEATGATLFTSRLDPLAQLVVAQRVAVALAETRGLDPDRPRNLTRSIVLSRH